MINRILDTLIAIALLVGVFTYFSNDDFDLESESSPIEAKIQHYCDLAEFNDNVPKDVREACQKHRPKESPQDNEQIVKPEKIKLYI